MNKVVFQKLKEENKKRMINMWDKLKIELPKLNLKKFLNLIIVYNFFRKDFLMIEFY